MPKSFRFYTQQLSTQQRVLLFLVEVFRPVFWLVRVVCLVLFGWWLGPLFDRWIRTGFAQEIEEKIPFLVGTHVSGYGGRIVADPKPSANDTHMDYVCVASATLIFKFRRWHRENYGIEVAPTFAPTDSFELLDALLLLDPGAHIERSNLDVDWRYWGKLLEPRFRLLQQAFDAEHFADTKAALVSQQSGRGILGNWLRN
jgi:hypothetical protein